MISSQVPEPGQCKNNSVLTISLFSTLEPMGLNISLSHSSIASFLWSESDAPMSFSPHEVSLNMCIGTVYEFWSPAISIQYPLYYLEAFWTPLDPENLPYQAWLFSRISYWCPKGFSPVTCHLSAHLLTCWFIDELAMLAPPPSAWSGRLQLL